VWRAFCQVESWPRWFPTLTAVARPASGPFALEEHIVLSLGFRGRGTRVDVRVVESAEGRVRWVGRSFGVTGDHAFFVEPLGDGRARFGSDEIFTGFPVRLLPRFVWNELTAECRRGLERFRTLVETEAA
jgi:hypothetical protein